MDTLPLRLDAGRLALRDTAPLPVVPLPRAPLPTAPLPRAADEHSATVPDEADAGRRPALPVLAPLLPALLLVGLCVAGLSDPQPASGGSRLHVPPPVTVPAVPLTR